MRLGPEQTNARVIDPCIDKTHEECYLHKLKFPKVSSKAGGLGYVAGEAGFEAKAYEEGRTGGGIGTGRLVFVAGGRRNDGNRRAGCEYADADGRTESRNDSR